MPTLSEKIDSSKSDNLNLIRLLLAMTVIFSHSYSLILGSDNFEPFNRWTHDITFGTLAVYGFFFISGFLITGSWQRSKTFLDYFLKRVLRIYPGYIVAVLFCAALIWIICPEFKSLIVQNGWTGQWIKMVARDAALLKCESISDVHAFINNPRPGLTNGPLWTIPVEFGCYLAILAVGIFGILRRRLIALVLAALGYEFCIMLLQKYNDRYDPLYLCFAFGALAWLWKDKIPFSPRIAAISLLTLIGTSHFRPYFSVAFPLAGGYCLLWLAYAVKLPLAKWAGTTDLSYGTYLYGCPVQQVLITCPALRHPWMNFLLAIPFTLMLAWLSWTLVERPCLSLKRRLRKAKATDSQLLFATGDN